MKQSILCLATILVIVGASGLAGPGLFSQERKILAKIGEKVITQDDLDVLVKMYEPLRRGNPATPEDKKNLLNRLINNTLISTEAEKEKLDQKPEIQIKLKMYRNELLLSEYIATKVAPLVTIKEEEVEAILKSNPNSLLNETVTLREILVETEKEAGEIYQELKKGGDFARMATEKSIAETKTKGGLIGPIPKNQFPPLFAEAISPLKEGEFSKPIKTEDGYRIFYLVNRKEIPPEQLKMLEGKLRERVFQLEKTRRIDVMLEQKAEELKKQTKVETYFDQLK